MFSFKELHADRFFLVLYELLYELMFLGRIELDHDIFRFKVSVYYPSSLKIS